MLRDTFSATFIKRTRDSKSHFDTRLKATPRRLAAACAAIALLGIHSTASAQDSTFYGLLRNRDLTPFGLMRLDMRPAHAVAIEPGNWALESGFGYQNTWALSPGVENYLSGLDTHRRRNLGLEDLRAIQALPGENYLVDSEQSTLDLTLHYKFSRNWAGYLTLSALTYQGGFLDGMIEKFHDTFSFSNVGRPAAKRNDVNLIYNLKGAKVAYFGAPTSGGISDPTVGLRYVGVRMPGPWQLSLEAAAKIPVAGERMLLSTGRSDYGVQASLQRLGRRHAIYVNAAAVYYAGARVPALQEAQIVPTLIAGYEYRLTSRTNLNLQGYVSESVYSRRVTDLDELVGEKYQVSMGVRHRVQNVVLTFGITENIKNFNNTPDVGFQLGVAYLPQ